MNSVETTLFRACSRLASQQGKWVHRSDEKMHILHNLHNEWGWLWSLSRYLAMT